MDNEIDDDDEPDDDDENDDSDSDDIDTNDELEDSNKIVKLDINSDNIIPPEKTKRGLRSARAPKLDYKTGYNALMEALIIKPCDKFGERYGFARHVMLAQTLAKKGLEKSGERDPDAVIEEFQ